MSRLRRIRYVQNAHSPAAASCAETARLLCRLLERTSWAHLRYSERRRLGRALDRAAGKIALARTILAAPDTEGGEQLPEERMAP